MGNRLIDTGWELEQVKVGRLGEAFKTKRKDAVGSKSK